MRPQCLVKVTACSRILDDARHDAPITPDEPKPLRCHFDKIYQPPRIKDERMDDRHAVTPLLAELAAQETELQRVNTLDTRRAGKDGQRIQYFGAVDARNHGAGNA